MEKTIGIFSKLFGSFDVLTAVLIAYVLTWWDTTPEPIQRLIIAGFALVLFDAVLRGLVAAKAHEFASVRVTDSIIKVITYGCGYGVLIALEYALGLPNILVITLAALIVYRDGTSCLEHLNTLGVPLQSIEQRLRGWYKEQNPDGDE